MNFRSVLWVPIIIIGAVLVWAGTTFDRTQTKPAPVQTEQTTQTTQTTQATTQQTPSSKADTPAAATVNPISVQGENYVLTGTASGVSSVSVIVSAISPAKYTGGTYLAEGEASVVNGKWTVSLAKDNFSGFEPPYHVVVRTAAQVLIQSDVAVQ